MGRKRPVNAGRIIAEVMEKNNLTKDDIPDELPFNEDMITDGRLSKSKRYFLEKGQAGFVCWEQDGKIICRQWSSYQASAIIDLKDQCILVDVGKQGCRNCEHERDPDKWSRPHFGKKAIEEMARRAVGEEAGSRGGSQYGRPAHDQSLCKLCKLLGRRCC